MTTTTIAADRRVATARVVMTTAVALRRRVAITRILAMTATALRVAVHRWTTIRRRRVVATPTTATVPRHLRVATRSRIPI